MCVCAQPSLDNTFSKPVQMVTFQIPVNPLFAINSAESYNCLKKFAGQHGLCVSDEDWLFLSYLSCSKYDTQSNF